MHTDARPRGFTLLCREVGLRLAESAGPLLRAALTLHDLETKLDAGRPRRADRRPDEAPEPSRLGRGTRVPHARRRDHGRRRRAEGGQRRARPPLRRRVPQGGRRDGRRARFPTTPSWRASAAMSSPSCFPGSTTAPALWSPTRVSDALQNHPGLDGYPLCASVGHAADSLAEAYRLADERMYESKTSHVARPRGPGHQRRSSS